MNQQHAIQALLGKTDIYLVDQIMKGLYHPTDKILDAGCGNGRNMHWFLQNDFKINGIDSSEEAINQLKNNYPLLAHKFIVSSIEKNTFRNDEFDHIICSAVLHFAKNTEQFLTMITELVRILKPGGKLFIRMASDIGIENKIHHIADGVYFIPDGSERFLLTKSLLMKFMHQHNLHFAEPLKTTNVDDLRCMSTLLLQK